MNFRTPLELGPSYTDALEVDIDAPVARPVVVLDVQEATIPVPSGAWLECDGECTTGASGQHRTIGCRCVVAPDSWCAVRVTENMLCRTTYIGQSHRPWRARCIHDLSAKVHGGWVHTEHEKIRRMAR